MNIEHLKEYGTDIAAVTSETVLITDVPSALDLAMSVKYKTSATKLVLDKRIFCEDFFLLSTGIAGEILQKFINYHIKAAIYGGLLPLHQQAAEGFYLRKQQGEVFLFST